MGKDQFRIEYFLNEEPVRQRFISAYKLFSNHSDQLSALTGDSLKDTCDVLIDFLINKGIIKTREEIFSFIQNEEFVGREKVLLGVLNAFFILHLLGSNIEKLKKLSNKSKDIFTKKYLNKIDALVLDRTLKRTTKEWRGREHVDLILASLDKERVFLSKTTLAEADKISPLFYRRSHSLQQRKIFELKDCYRLLQQVQIFPFFNRVRFQNNTQITQSELDIEKLHFLSKPLEDINVLTRSDYINEFLLDLNGDLVNYSLTPVQIEEEKLSKFQGCVDLILKDSISKRKARYYFQSVDIPSLEKGKYYLIALKNVWGFGTSLVIWASEISESQFKTYSLLSYIANRRRVDISYLREIGEKIGLSFDNIKTNKLIDKFTFWRDNFVYYTPASIREELIFFLKQNISFKKYPSDKELGNFVSKEYGILEIIKKIRKVIVFFELNEDKREFYSDGWNPNLILTDSLTDEKTIYGPDKYGVWINSLSVEEIQNFVSIFGYQCMQMKNLLVFKKNEKFIIYDLNSDLFINNGEKLESLLYILKTYPLLSYVASKIDRDKPRLVRFSQMDKSYVWIYLFMKRNSESMFEQKTLVNQLENFFRYNDVHQIDINKILGDLLREEIIIKISSPNKELLCLNPFVSIDFTVFLADREDYFYLKILRYGLNEFNEQITIKTNEKFSDKNRLELFQKRYLNKYYSIKFISDYELKVSKL